MKSPNKQADNVTMSEGGLYSLATKGAKDVIDIATPRVLDAIRDMGKPAERFMLADMGCADAGTSLEMIGNAIAEIQTLNPKSQITVVYADQPANDFNALVDIVHGRTQFDSWLGRMEGAFSLFSGTSFYLQAVPDGTIDFIFSATAMHWLSTKPSDISDHVHMVGAHGDELTAFSEQASKDWETILLCRAKELKVGGKMVLVNFCRDPQGYYLGNTGGVNMFDNFANNWREFLRQGKITEAEFLAMTLPQYYNTVEEFSQPMELKHGAVYQAGLRLDSIETRVVRCPFAEQFKLDGDVEKFADGLIPTIRSWNQSIFRAGLDDDRNDDEKNTLIEDYYNTYRRQVIENPSGHGMDYVHAYMTLSKVD